ncbi:MAG: acyltransferase family protein [Candidatus Solibacter usitatus]|nr:acyltransferase family protein [Candidatus Solibacter usitatus]
MAQEPGGPAAEWQPRERFASLDLLRVSMMLLGIPFHTSVAYRGFASPGHFSDPHGDWWWLFLMEVVHVFRMPVFYFLAGFFTAKQVASRGVSGMTRSRLARVGVVWILALALLTPLVYWLGVFNHFAGEGGGAWDKTWKAIQTGSVEAGWLAAPPLHLWFLEYLLLFCLAGAAVSMAAARMPAFAAAERAAGRILMSRMRVLALSIPFCALLWNATSGRLPYPGEFTPRLDLFLGYGFFFGAGWLLYRRRELLPELWSLRWHEILVGVAALAVNAFCFKLWADFRDGAPAWTHAAGVVSGAVGAWATLFALLGLASKSVARPSAWLRYSADACYWTYLMHFPLALLFPALLAGWTAPSVVKVAGITVLILALMLLSYHLFVRRTFIGRLLHGPRQ